MNLLHRSSIYNTKFRRLLLGGKQFLFSCYSSWVFLVHCLSILYPTISAGFFSFLTLSTISPAFAVFFYSTTSLTNPNRTRNDGGGQLMIHSVPWIILDFKTPGCFIFLELWGVDTMNMVKCKHHVRLGDDHESWWPAWIPKMNQTKVICMADTGTTASPASFVQLRQLLWASIERKD